MRATVRVRMATDKGVAAGLAWDDMSDGVCQAATLSVAIRGQQNFRQAGHGIGPGCVREHRIAYSDLFLFVQTTQVEYAAGARDRSNTHRQR